MCETVDKLKIKIEREGKIKLMLMTGRLNSEGHIPTTANYLHPDRRAGGRVSEMRQG